MNANKGNRKFDEPIPLFMLVQISPNSTKNQMTLADKLSHDVIPILFMLFCSR